MTTPFENFVNTALGKSVSADVTLPTANDIPVFTGIGRQVTGKTLGELGIATTSALSGKEPTITVGTSSQYYRGDKSFQTLDTDAVPETATRVYLSPTQKTIATQAATTSVDGYLTSTDWTTFNGKQAALDDVITADTYGSSTQVPVITFNAKGIATTVTLATIAAPVLTEANFSVAKTGQPTYTVTWVLTALTSAKTWTVPDTNLDFGNIAKIPAVATPYTTGAMAGTRPQCVGGSSNTISGTDNVAIGCTGVVLAGTRNTAISSTRVGTDAAATDNSFYNCSSTQPAELVTTIGVRYENCTYVQLRNTVTWPNYSRVVGSANANGSSTMVYTRLSAINVNSTPQDMTTGGAGGNTEVIASLGIYTTALHDIVVIFTDLNGNPKSIFQRRVAVDSVGGIISNTTPVPDIVVGSTVYTLSISVVSGKLRLTVQSNIGTISACNAEVISRYF